MKVEETPDMKDKVAAAMADKYWMDVLIRHESHPMVARLVPEAASTPTPSTNHRLTSDYSTEESKTRWMANV